MRLEYVEIHDYRSIFVDGGGQPLRLDLADGANTLVGRNNCGKSNVLRAISLALDPNHEFVPDDDIPGPREFASPTVSLGFVGDSTFPEDATVLAAAESFEQSFIGRSGETMASKGRVVLRVSFVPTENGPRREEQLIIGGTGSAALGPESGRLLIEAIDTLRSAVRFVLISSGESIESVLEGNFREILHSVVRDQLSTEFSDAETSRQTYVDGLRESLLRPLRDRLEQDVGGLFPEINNVSLEPGVSSIEHTLSNVDVRIEDVVSTPIAGKGTGVRGGLLIAMLSYLAKNATRGMVFAVEEPEAFLHPGAQEDLRDHLEDLAAETGVSLIVTTHSPFIVTQSPVGKVFCLAKDNDGRTRVAESAAGDAEHAPLIGGLLRQTTIESLLEASSAIPTESEAVLLVEGEGDKFCLQHAAAVVGRSDLLDGLHVVGTGGTIKMVAHAVITKAATELPILLLIDNDDAGRKARDQLVGSTFGFERRQFITYADLWEAAQWKSFPVEAEDVFAPQLLDEFVEHHGDSVLAGQQRRPDDAWHYDFGQSAKELLNQWFQEHTEPEHVQRWIELILLIRQKAQLDLPEETAAEIVNGAQSAGSSTGGSSIPTDGDALVLTGQLDYARYESSGAIVLSGEQRVADSVTHVAFYNRSIQPAVPMILEDYPSLLFTASTIEQLRATGRQNDEIAAALIKSQVDGDASLAGAAHRVLVLSDPDDDRTVTLPAPIKNTKQSRGRPVAWTVGARLVAVAALRQAPQTTDEIDQLTQDEEGTPSA